MDVQSVPILFLKGRQEGKPKRTPRGKPPEAVPNPAQAWANAAKYYSLEEKPPPYQTGAA